MEIIPVNFTEKTERTPAGTAAVQEKAADLERQAVEAIGKNFVKASGGFRRTACRGRKACG